MKTTRLSVTIFVLVCFLNGISAFGQADSTMRILSFKNKKSKEKITALIPDRPHDNEVVFFSFFSIEGTDFLAVGAVHRMGESYLAVESAFRMSPFVGYMKYGDHDCYVFGQNAFNFGFRPTRKFKRTPTHFQYVHEIHKYQYIEQFPPYEKWEEQKWEEQTIPLFVDPYREYYIVKAQKCFRVIAHSSPDIKLMKVLDEKFLQHKIIYEMLKDKN